MVTKTAVKKTKHSKPATRRAAPARIFVTMVVDESGSMEHLAAATMDGFNSYVDALKRDGATGLFSAFKFNAFGGVKTLQCGATISEAMHLSPVNYQPNGGTPLLDAVGEAIRSTDAMMVNYDVKRAIIVIQTDGEENASRSHSLPQIKQMIEERQTKGWQFVFIGAGINAFADATRMGIYAMNTMSYLNNAAGTRAVFNAMAQNTQSYAQGQMMNMGFSAQQSAASGESAAILKQKLASPIIPQSRSA